MQWDKMQSCLNFVIFVILTLTLKCIVLHLILGAINVYTIDYITEFKILSSCEELKEI